MESSHTSLKTRICNFLLDGVHAAQFVASLKGFDDCHRT